MLEQNYYVNVVNNLNLEISQGKIAGHSNVFIAGRNRVTAMNTQATIWEVGGLYPWSAWDAGAAKIHVASDSASDTGKTVLISGLDANFDMQTEVVTLNGLTGVLTTKNFIRMNSAVNIGPTTIVGNATFKYGSSSGAVIGVIKDGEGMTRMSIYTVPRGYTAFTVYGDFSVSKNEAAELNSHWRFFGGTFIDVYSVQLYQNSFLANPPIPGALPEKTDIDNRVDYTTANNTAVYSNQQLLLIDNNYL